MKTFFSSIAALVLALTAAAQNAAPTDPKTGGVRETRDKEGTVQSQDGILRAQGSVIFLKKGVPNRVTYEMRLSEGLIVRPSGEVTLPNGQTINLQEGQMVTLEGKLTSAPSSLGHTGAASSKPADTGAKTDFGNTGATGPQNK